MTLGGKELRKCYSTECQSVLDPDQAQHSVEPDLGPNCVQKLLADNTRRQIVNEALFDYMSCTSQHYVSFHEFFQNYLTALLNKPAIYNSLSVKRFLDPENYSSNFTGTVCLYDSLRKYLISPGLKKKYSDFVQLDISEVLVWQWSGFCP